MCAEPSEFCDATFDRASEGILVTGEAGAVVRANPAACAMLQRTEEDIRRIGPEAIVEESSTYGALVERRARDLRVTGELIFRRADGSVFTAAVRSGLLPGVVGARLAWVIFRDATDRPRGGPARMPPSGPRSAKGAEVILVLDDDDGVRRFARHVLERAGYTVLTAESGLEAIALAEPEETVIDLVMSDVAMPGMSGPDAVHHMKIGRPSLRVLFMSGDFGALSDIGPREPEAVLIAKPFMPKSLLAQVRETLDQ